MISVLESDNKKMVRGIKIMEEELDEVKVTLFLSILIYYPYSLIIHHFKLCRELYKIKKKRLLEKML